MRDGTYRTNIDNFTIDVCKWGKCVKETIFRKDPEYSIEYREGDNGWEIMKNPEAKKLYEIIEKKYNEEKQTPEDRLLGLLEDDKD